VGCITIIGEEAIRGHKAQKIQKYIKEEGKKERRYITKLEKKKSAAEFPAKRLINQSSFETPF